MSPMPNKKPHIAFVLPHLVCGGAERATLTIARELIARGYAVDVLITKPHIDAEIADWIPEKLQIFSGTAQVEQGGGKQALIACPPRTASFWRDYMQMVLQLGYFPKHHKLHDARLIANYLVHRKPDLIIPGLTQFLPALMTPHFLRHTPPIVPIMHGPTSHKQGKKRHRHRLLQNAARVLTVSRGLGETLQRQSSIPAQRFVTIYNPVITPEMTALKQQHPDHPWFSDGGAPIVLGCGRLHDQKGFDVLLRAFARLRETRPCRLILLGEGEMRGELEGLITELGIGESVSLPGWVANPLAYMSQAQLFVLSSNHEGMGLVLVEALACGCPCVSTNCHSGPSEILQDGAIGELTLVKDDHALAAAMARTLDNPPPKEKLIARAEYFSLNRAIDAYEQLISEVVQNA